MCFFIFKHTLRISRIIFKNESNFEHNLEKNRALLVAYFATFTSTIVKGLMLPAVRVFSNRSQKMSGKMWQEYQSHSAIAEEKQELFLEVCAVYYY